MTCSSIVQFNFPLTSEINLNSLNSDKFLNSATSSKHQSTNHLQNNNIDLDQSINDFNQVADDNSNNNDEQLASLVLKNQILEKSASFLLNCEDYSDGKESSNLNESINNSKSETRIKSNMNNGLSNGHDLNLDFGLNSGAQLISTFDSPISTELQSAHTNFIVKSVSSSSSISQPNILINTTNAMGILPNSDKEDFLLMKGLGGNKIENGQSLMLDPVPRWPNDYNKINDNILESLPHLNKNAYSNQNLFQTSSSTTIPKTLNSNVVPQQTLKTETSPNYIISTNNLTDDNLNLVLNCDEKIQQQTQSINLNNASKEEVRCPDEFSSSIVSKEESSSLGNLSKQDPQSIDENHALFDDQNDYIRRLRRLHVQYTHQKLTKQMKKFVQREQKLNSVKCQRLDFDFPHYIINNNNNNDYPDIDNKFKLSQQDFPIQRNNCSNSSNIKSTITSPSSFLNSTSQPSCSFKNDFHQNKSSSSHHQSSSNHFVFNQATVDLNYHHNKSSNYSSDAKFKQLKQQQNSNNNNNQHVLKRTTLSQDKILLQKIDDISYDLRHVESKFDSDATDSSSGGESCDEFENDFLDNCSTTYSTTATSLSSSSPTTTLSPTKHKTSIRNCSSWKWYNERNNIASRWSWLEAQIFDLGRQVRNQMDMFHDIRTSKGTINFGENGIIERQFPSFPSSPSDNNQKNHSNVSNQQKQQGLISPGNNSNSLLILNEEGNLHQQNNIENNNSNNSEESGQCMRTMPFINKKHRNRNLIFAESSLSMAVKKSVKYSSIQCSCNIYPLYVSPCVICNGRSSYMHSIDTEFMPYYERVSLLDSSCHPKLSLPNDVPLELHFTHFLKRETLNNNLSLTRNNKKNKKLTLQPFYPTPNEKKSKKSSSQPSTKSKKNKTITKIKPKKRRLSSDSVRRNQRERLSSECSSRGESPVPSPVTSDGGSSNGASVTTPTNAPLNRRRRSEQHAFDINNIVIPYSIAATTRVERLQYKEIITPKWRLIEEYSIPPPDHIKQEILSKTNGKNSNIEDISDEMYQERHSKCELSERQRIMTYYGNKKNQNAISKRTRVRFESKSDSMDQTSQDSFSSSKIKSKSNANNDYERKRATSISKSGSKEDFSSPASYINEETFTHETIAPYESRKFPLPDWLYEKMVQETYDQKEEEERRCRRTSKLSSVDDYDLLDDSTGGMDGHQQQQQMTNSPTTLVDINDENFKGHFYRDDDAVFEENDDPEWKPDL